MECLNCASFIGSAAAIVFEPFKKFYLQMTNPQYNAVTDVYALMFLCDVIVFLITIFGYWAFGPVVSHYIVSAQGFSQVTWQSFRWTPSAHRLFVGWLI